ncbi:hypothetical protein A2U01_0079757, partial [Trifolium medium]|nr:hypothetical protein [Trifolium medium]
HIIRNKKSWNAAGLNAVVQQRMQSASNSMVPLAKS